MASPRPEQKNEPWKDPGAQPYVRVEKLTKRFGDFVAVDDVTLNIYRNEIFCLLGGSGSGKTTLLRMMAGFERPSEGRIWIDGADVTATPPYERPVNMMFQSYALFPHMSVQKNVAFGLRQDKVSAAEIDQRVAEILKLVRMEQFAKRMPHQLSGGQRQRVALARALVKRPKLMLLDEPLAALDKKLREHTQFELLNIQETLGVTFVVVTHDQEEAMTLATRIGVMNHGEIVQIGTPSDIYEYPSSRFVADFIGSVNMFEGRLDRGRAGLRARRLGRARRHLPRRPRRERRTGRDRLGRAAAGEDRAVARAPRGRRRQPRRGRGRRGRLPRRPVHLPGQARERAPGARYAAEHAAHRCGRPDPLGRPRLAQLGFLEPGGGYPVSPTRSSNRAASRSCWAS